MYHLILYLYQFGVFVCSFFSEKVSKMWKGERRAVADIREKLDPEAQYVWFHAASLGEFEQGRPLMEQLRRDHPEYKILLTFFSPSGYEVRKNYEGADIITYLPIDTVTNARRFLRTIRPVMAFFIKYEFWYNYLHILRHRNVPVYSVSSIFRPDQVFFKWYGRQYGHVLKCFSHFYVQNEVSKELLAKIGINCVTVVGADEDIFIPYFNTHSDWKMIIAPHVIGEDHLSQIIGKVKGKVVRYSQTTPEEAATAKVLIIDCFGLLSSIYAYAKVAYVGGGFGVGIHNVLEAAVWGVPVIFGPNNQRFLEAQQLKASTGGIEIADHDSFAAVMDGFIADADTMRDRGQRAADYVAQKAGTTKKILDAVGL